MVNIISGASALGAAISVLAPAIEQAIQYGAKDPIGVIRSIPAQIRKGFNETTVELAVIAVLADMARRNVLDPSFNFGKIKVHLL